MDIVNCTCCKEQFADHELNDDNTCRTCVDSLVEEHCPFCDEVELVHFIDSPLYHCECCGYEVTIGRWPDEWYKC